MTGTYVVATPCTGLTRMDRAREWSARGGAPRGSWGWTFGDGVTATHIEETTQTVSASGLFVAGLWDSDCEGGHVRANYGLVGSALPPHLCHYEASLSHLVRVVGVFPALLLSTAVGVLRRRPSRALPSRGPAEPATDRGPSPTTGREHARDPFL